jgi:uncharacterized membrane protein YedE/YeeE
MSTDFDPRFDPAFQRGYQAPAVPDGPSAGLRRNPWVWSLWIVGVLLTGGGILAQLPWEPAGGPESAYVIPALLAALGPWFLGAGLAAIVGVMLLHAVRWRQ